MGTQKKQTRHSEDLKHNSLYLSLFAKVFSQRDIQGQCGWHLGKIAPHKREQIDWLAKRSPSMAKYGKLCLVWQLGSCILQQTYNACSNADKKSSVLLHQTKNTTISKHHSWMFIIIQEPSDSNSNKKHSPFSKHGYTRHLNKTHSNLSATLQLKWRGSWAVQAVLVARWKTGFSRVRETPKGREPPHEFRDKHWIRSHVWIPFRECGPWWNK